MKALIIGGIGKLVSVFFVVYRMEVSKWLCLLLLVNVIVSGMVFGLGLLDRLEYVRKKNNILLELCLSVHMYVKFNYVN